MSIAEVYSKKLNTPLGVFSQAVKVSDATQLLFVSGLTSRAPSGEVVGVGDVKVQTETILENMKTVLEEAGGSMADIVKLTVFIRDMEQFDEIHEVRRRYFSQPLPASSMFQVSRLVDEELLIEIEAIAAIGESGR
jgi:2-iminobutanoate/2-iminopropanoate deaminase